MYEVPLGEVAGYCDVLHGYTMSAKTRVIKVDSRHYIKVHVWDTLAELRKAGRKDGDGTSWRTTVAFFRSKRISIAPTLRPVTRVLTNYVGDIHLAKGRYDGAVFAHEFQHFISHWIDVAGLEPTGKDWENVAHIAGRMTGSFWTWHHAGLK